MASRSKIQHPGGFRLALAILSVFALAAPAPALATCGDGFLEPTEECDDGNARSGDCCSSSCLLEPAGSVCRAAGAASLSGPGQLPAGAFEWPGAISEFWFKNKSSPCGNDSGGDTTWRVRMYPTGGQGGETEPIQACTGFHTFHLYPATASSLGSVLDGLRTSTFASPATVTGSTVFNFTGGTVATQFNRMKQLYDARKDASGNWTFLLPVYESSDCANASGAVRIVGVTTARIFSVTTIPEKTIDANVDCNVIYFGEAGGNDYGTKVASHPDCDVAEYCDGSSPTCPADLRQPAGTSCSDDDRLCTTDVCNSEGDCNLPGGSGTLCRPSAGICDPPESCSGLSSYCSDDVLWTSSLTCRASAGPCDATETCNGSSASCPADALRGTSTVCRSSAAVCDAAERCTGSSPACPADVYASTSTVCRNATAVCDPAETCSGDSTACPSNAFAPTSTTCRAATGGCDAVERCTGSSGACPADGFAASTTTCRASAGECDVAESCNGGDGSCAADSFLAANTACGSDDNICTDDVCSGSSPSCQHTGSSAPCDDGLFCNGSDTCSDGSCSLHAGDACSGPDGDGDCSESCDEAADDCLAADPDDSACDDGNAATDLDHCQDGQCVAFPIPLCGDADGFCPEDCSIEIDADCQLCLTRSLALADCDLRIKRRRTPDGTDRLRVKCVVDACAAPDGIVPSDTGVSLTVADSSGTCFAGGTAAAGCLQKSNGFVCRPASSGLAGLRILKLKARSTCEYAMLAKAAESDLSCLDSARSPWVPTFVVGDDCGDVGCPIAVADRGECSGTCGNDALDTGEQCDGGDDASCPGLCEPTCTCR